MTLNDLDVIDKIALVQVDQNNRPISDIKMKIKYMLLAIQPQLLQQNWKKL